jgi:hypothetical protein
MYRFKGFDSTSLCSLAGRYDNHSCSVSTASINCSKIPAQKSFERIGETICIGPVVFVFTIFNLKEEGGLNRLTICLTLYAEWAGKVLAL